MCCCLHLRNTYNHVSASSEVQIGHVWDGYAVLPKKSCFLACPIYCPVLNFTKHVFCLSVIAGLFQKSFDNVCQCLCCRAIYVIGVFGMP